MIQPFSFIFVSILSLCHFLQQCKNCHDLCANLALTVWPCLAVIISPLIRTILNIEGKQPRLFPPPPAEEVCCTVTGAGTIKYGVKMYKNIFGIPQLCYNIHWSTTISSDVGVANTNILFMYLINSVLIFACTLNMPSVGPECRWHPCGDVVTICGPSPCSGRQFD